MSDTCTTNCKNSEIILCNRKKISSYNKLDKTSNFYKLLANDTRLKILLILFDGKLCVCDIAESLRLSVPAISQQLKMLKQAEVLTQENRGKTVYYLYADQTIKEVIEMLIFNIVK